MGIGPPVRIVVNLVLADGGTVDLRPLKLLQYRSSWWTEADGGWIGGIVGHLAAASPIAPRLATIASLSACRLEQEAVSRSCSTLRSPPL